MVLCDVFVRFPAEFDATSSHHLRSSFDMQFSFSYMYYIIHEPATVELDDVLRDYIDSNHDK